MLGRPQNLSNSTCYRKLYEIFNSLRIPKQSNRPQKDAIYGKQLRFNDLHGPPNPEIKCCVRSVFVATFIKKEIIHLLRVNFSRTVRAFNVQILNTS